jgi:hypothetical protein
MIPTPINSSYNSRDLYYVHLWDNMNKRSVELGQRTLDAHGYFEHYRKKRFPEAMPKEVVFHEYFYPETINALRLSVANNIGWQDLETVIALRQLKTFPKEHKEEDIESVTKFAKMLTPYYKKHGRVRSTRTGGMDTDKSDTLTTSLLDTTPELGVNDYQVRTPFRRAFKRKTTRVKLRAPPSVREDEVSDFGEDGLSDFGIDQPAMVSPKETGKCCGAGCTVMGGKKSRKRRMTKRRKMRKTRKTNRKFQRAKKRQSRKKV